MKVSALELVDSPRGPEWTRARVHVRYQGLLPASEWLWYDVPASLRQQVSPLGDPWLTALLPLAVTRGEPIELEAPITSEKRANAAKLMETWAEWYASLAPIAIRAPHANQAASQATRRAGCFFSGGADSLYTVLHDRETSGGTIDELIFIHGADIPADRQHWFQTTNDTLLHVAQDLDLPLLTVATNLRQTRFDEASYDSLASGSPLASVGLLLEARYRRIVISSTWGGEEIHPGGGSHPATDPLHSNDGTRFEHYGAWTNRESKLKFLSRHPIALENLRVCWGQEGPGNCGHCMKCLRTMTVLEVLGALPQSSTFEADELDLELLRRQVLTLELRYFRRFIPFARDHGREDVAEAIEAAISRSERIQRILLFGLVLQAYRKLRLHPSARRWLRLPYHALRRLGIWVGRRFGRL